MGRKRFILKKKALAALLLLAVGFSAFADMGMYFKGTIGYGYRSRSWTSNYYDDDRWRTQHFGTNSNLFVIVPTFGIEPWRGNGNVFLRGLGFEFSLDLGFGGMSGSRGADLGASIVIDPRAMAVYTYHGKLLMPYGGIGVSVPIVIAPTLGGSRWNNEYNDTSGVKAGFNVNIMAGLGFQVTPRIAPTIELDFGFGTGTRVDVRTGIVYAIK